MLKNLCLLMLITPSVGLAITERQATIATYATLATVLGAAAIKRGDDRAVAWILGAGALATMGTRWICSKFTPDGRLQRAQSMANECCFRGYDSFKLEVKDAEQNSWRLNTCQLVGSKVNDLIAKAGRDGKLASKDLASRALDLKKLASTYQPAGMFNKANLSYCSIYLGAFVKN